MIKVEKVICEPKFESFDIVIHIKTKEDCERLMQEMGLILPWLTDRDFDLSITTVGLIAEILGEK